MTGLLLPLAGESSIEIGHHVEREFLGMTVNVDTIVSTLVAGALVLLLGLWARRQLTRNPDDHVPTKLQILWEAVVGEVNSQVEQNIGKVHPYVAPLAICLFFFILLANWLELIPSEINHETGHLLPAPTADTNLTYALAVVTMISVWIYGIREQGARNYFKHFLQPFPALAPLNVLEELTKPITLALRLFGNIFAGGIMLSLIGLLPLFALWAPNLLWKAFDMFIGVIQAFIFALLTVIYFAMAGAGHGDDHEEHDRSDDERDRTVDEHGDDHQETPALAR